jgi:integrase
MSVISLDILRYLPEYCNQEWSPGITLGFPIASRGNAVKLDAKTVARLALPPGKADVITFDSTMPGFGYRMRRSGDEVLRSWVVQYKRAARTRRLLLGPAEVLSAEQARSAAKRALAAIALGQDPQADKAQRRAKDELTLKRLLDKYLAAKESALRPKSFDEAKRYLSGPYFRPLHGMAADLITRRDVAARVLVIGRENGSVASARARSALSAAFAWGIASGLVDGLNPVVGTPEPSAPEPRDRVLNDEELRLVWLHAGDDDYAAILRLLILTAQRRGEVGGMRASEIVGDAWTIPGSRAKNARAHTVPIVGLAREIIDAALRRTDRDHLFGDRASKGFTPWVRSKAKLDRRLGSQVRHFTLHDLRRSAASGAADLGTNPFTIELLLNHTPSPIARTYNKNQYLREIQTALLLWDSHIRSLIEGTESKVVSFRSTAG